MENDPHQLIEGILIGGLRGGCAQGLHLYSRRISLLDPDHGSRHRGSVCARLSGQEHPGDGLRFRLYTHTGAGAYECGEETALLDSIEGKRGIPRMKPPFPAVAGAWQSPTLLNNVETFSAVPAIIRDGGAAFAALGTPKNGGTRMVCLSGHINKPGVYELPMGFNLLPHDLRSRRRNARREEAEGGGAGGSSCPLLTRRRMRHRDGFRHARPR